VRICSLFSGIGGIETGFLRVFKDAKIVFSSELDPKTAAAYELWFKHKPHGDITKVKEKDIPDHDILVGGFPCQAFSVAGKRLGFEDTRGTLFFDVARIIKKKQPKMFVLENVKGLLSHEGGKTFSTIISILSELNYLVDFEIMNSKFFGVPQNRERIVIVGLKKSKKNKSSVWNITSPHKKVNEIKKELQATIQNLNSFNFDFPEQTDVTKKLVDILEDNVDKKYTLPVKYTEDLIKKINAKVQEESNPIDCKAIQMERHHWNDLDRQRRIYTTTGIAPTLLARQDSPKIIMVGKLNMKAGEQIKNVYSEEGLSPTIDTAQGAHRQVKILTKDNNELYIRKITPLEALRVQGFSDNFYKLIREHKYSDTHIYKMAGNAVTVNVFEAIAEKIKNYI
jgi:DNA (cytosine-5)-methyltransferase 1